MAIRKVKVRIEEAFPEFAKADGTPGHTIPNMLIEHAYRFERDPGTPGEENVPTVDPSWIFGAEVARTYLMAIMGNMPVMAVGPTGSGKSAGQEQFAARLGYEFYRMQFSPSTTRYDIVGRTSVRPDGAGGKDVYFSEGPVVRALPRPAIVQLDEFDRGNPAESSVLHGILEAREGHPGRLWVEELGHYVTAHRDFRVMATGNTNGLDSDTDGIYVAASQQDMATYDRFPLYTVVPYAGTAVERKIVKDLYPGFPEAILDKLLAFVDDYRAAYEGAAVTAELSKSLSTRSVLAVAKATMFTGSLATSLATVMFDRLNEEQSRVVIELARKVGIEVA